MPPIGPGAQTPPQHSTSLEHPICPSGMHASGAQYALMFCVDITCAGNQKPAWLGSTPAAALWSIAATQIWRRPVPLVPASALP